MRRRQLLTLVGAGFATATAGCFGFGRSGANGNGTSNGSDGSTPNAPPVSEAVELTDHQLTREDEGTLAETVSVEGSAQNTSDARLTGIQIRVRFLDDGGEVLGTTVTDGRTISGGGTWSYTIPFNETGSEARAVADYEIAAGEGFDASSGTAETAGADGETTVAGTENAGTTIG